MPFLSYGFASAKNFDVVFEGAREECAGVSQVLGNGRFPYWRATGSLQFHFGLGVRRDRQFCTSPQQMTDKTRGSSVYGNEPLLPGCARGCGVMLRRRTVAGVFVSVALVVFFFFLLLLSATPAFAQGGPPYYTNDPGTPGPFNWEINLGYMPFFYSNQSVSHAPDVDINFGIGDRIQLTYENAWLRVQNPSSPASRNLAGRTSGWVNRIPA